MFLGLQDLDESPGQGTKFEFHLRFQVELIKQQEAESRYEEIKKFVAGTAAASRHAMLVFLVVAKKVDSKVKSPHATWPCGVHLRIARRLFQSDVWHKFCCLACHV